MIRSPSYRQEKAPLCAFLFYPQQGVGTLFRRAALTPAYGSGTRTQPQQNTLIVLFSTYLYNLSTCCRLLQLRGGEPPQADYSAKKAIWHYSLVASQIIMGGAPRAPAESKAFYNPTYTHILCFTVKCVLLRLDMGTLILYTFRNICQYRRPGVYPYGYENNIAHMSASSFLHFIAYF